ncbi:XRE family transcriptional regulator [Mycobacterium cookii]|uniref:Putative transcription regulator protein n=1 Tax=Mycobacterium cookii TaxID=1775 RepID=A0A7I7KRE2_9MYCO|nr:XRE family transcriptional regulator [Mycobacterium cookii]MCV7328588.1 helix-turn-helix transcriptional regulator [Mycobacterium cookii]BBX44324.1 putative transcription regulator protein [Mycobacterium cookii]
MTGLLRAVRRERGLTLAILAERTGLTKSYLSKIERQQSTPSIAVALKVARALDVDVAQLFCDKSAELTIEVDRADDRSRDAGHYQLLAPNMLGKAMSPFIVRPFQGEDDHFPAHPGQEFLFVHAGTVELQYGENIVTLAAGDSAYFDASVNHDLRAVGKSRAQVVVVAYNEPRDDRG